MHKKQNTISIIIPVYNEEKYIIKTLDKVIASNTLHFEKEIIVVDDGSTDHTPSLVNTFIKKNNKKIRLITKKNEGKGSALKLGFLQSHGDIVIVQDADLEYNPDEYPTLLTPFSNMLTNLNLTDMETGYKVFKGEIIRSIAPHLESKRFGFEPEITACIAKIKNIAIYEVGISYQGRTYDEGKKISWRDGVRAIGEIVKYNLFSSAYYFL